MHSYTDTCFRKVVQNLLIFRLGLFSTKMYKVQKDTFFSICESRLILGQAKRLKHTLFRICTSQSVICTLSFLSPDRRNPRKTLFVVFVEVNTIFVLYRFIPGYANPLKHTFFTIYTSQYVICTQSFIMGQAKLLPKHFFIHFEKTNIVGVICSFFICLSRRCECTLHPLFGSKHNIRTLYISPLSCNGR